MSRQTPRHETLLQVTFTWQEALSIYKSLEHALQPGNLTDAKTISGAQGAQNKLKASPEIMAYLDEHKVDNRPPVDNPESGTKATPV